MVASRLFSRRTILGLVSAVCLGATPFAYAQKKGAG